MTPEYLRTSDDAYALSDYGPALGRRFRSLKLWAVLRCYGRRRAAADPARARPARRPLRRLGGGGARTGSSARRTRFSLVVFRRNGIDEDNEELLATRQPQR